MTDNDARAQGTIVPVERATLHASAYVDLNGEMAMSPQIGDDLALPEDGEGWVQSPPHVGEPAFRSIVFWHKGKPLTFFGTDRELHEGDTAMYELPLRLATDDWVPPARSPKDVPDEHPPPTLAEFLLARLAEEEQVARAAGSEPW